MPIIASGIGSGLDIANLVSQLVAAEADPVNSRLNAQELELESEVSAFGTLKSALSAFETSLGKLQDSQNFSVYTATSSNDSVFAATTDSTAVAGSYAIEVVQLATAAKLKSADFTSSSEVIGTGTLDISLGATTFQITVDSNNNTLEGIRDAINAASDNPGVTASIINVDSGTQLILSSSSVGASNTISVTATDDDPLDGFDLGRLDSANLVSLQSPQDAIIKVDSQTVTRASNRFSDVITGVTFDLKDAQPGVSETLDVLVDTESVKKDIDSFVTNYNTLLGVMRGLSKYDPATNEAGALNGDSVIRSIQNRLQVTVATTVSGGAFSNLSELGITVDDSGSLTTDDSVLNDKLNNSLGDVSQFFSSANGLANVFSTALSGYSDNDGIIDARTDGLQTRLNSIDDKREVLQRRMDAYEARLNAQFTAMDILVSQLQSTGTFLTQQLASLPSIASSS